MDYSKLKKQARKNLQGNYGPLVISLLVFAAISIVCTFIGKVTCSPLLEYALYLIAESLLIMGFVKMIVKVSKKKKPVLDDLISETDSFLKYIVITIIVGLILGILFLIAAIAFKSLISVLAHVNEINFILALVLILFGILLVAAVIGVIVYLTVSFSQTLFILHDEKKLSATQVLSKSFDMMYGYVLEYIILTITFIGWMVLGIFTFGILYLWLIPYMMVTYANFYKEVKKNYKAISGDKEPEKIFNDKDVKEEGE